MKAGRPDEAREEFSRVVQGDPSNEAALVEYAKVLHRQRAFKLALDVLEKSYARYPQRGRTAVLLAYLLASSPAAELRDGARALELAQRVYGATSAVQHGALVALALAELGRCREAAEWQQRMIVAAASRTELLVRLRASLELYESQACRPAGDASLAELGFYER